MKQYLPILLVLASASCGQKEESEPKPVVAVKTARAEAIDLRQTVQAPATIFPREQASIAARITAPIRRLLARKGDRVAAGQVLAELENRDLIAQRAEALANVADAEANLQKLSAGTLPTDVERARGQVAAAEAALNQAQKIYDRRAELFAKGAIPQRDLLVSETELAQAKISHEVARRSLDLLVGQSREKDIAIARSRLEQARARLSNLDAQLAFAEIRSPFGGTITEQWLYPGDMAKPDAPIFTVMDLTLVVARAQVQEAGASGIRTGQDCSFVSADDPNVVHDGRVSMVNQAVDPQRRTVEVWCEVPNRKHTQRAGVFGTAQIVTGVAAGSVVVPVDAVQFEEGTRKGVVFVAERNRALRREVQTGEQEDGKVRILSGVKAGENVIVEGAYGLADGGEIRPAAAGDWK